MKIKSIQLEKFKGFVDLKVKFPNDSKLAVFIGENGGGKSSLLEAISMILRESLKNQHQYEAINWDDPLNVNCDFDYGRITVELSGLKRMYELGRTVTANRLRFTSIEKLALQLNRDLTDLEKSEFYKMQGDIAWDGGNNVKAFDYYSKSINIQGISDKKELAFVHNKLGRINYQNGKYTDALTNFMDAVKIAESIPDKDPVLLLNFNFNIATIYWKLKDYENCSHFWELAKQINILKLINEEKVSEILYMLGFSYFNLKEYNKAIDNFKALLEENSKSLRYSNSEIKRINLIISKSYEYLGNLSDSEKYNKNAESIIIDRPTKESKDELIVDKNDSVDSINEDIDVWKSVILQYKANDSNSKKFKDALSIAFNIPMTTDFDMISDWFIEHENDENRKRLRASFDYRSLELDIIRDVIKRGLCLLNNVEDTQYTDLQTEIDESVNEGQVTSWLSIKKNGIRLNVNQLSDGEKRVLVLIIDIARRLITAGKLNKVDKDKYLQGTGIVLIDEIEQHLHPKWQRAILPTLNKLFPNLQFVVTTHSPQVLSYVPNGSAFSLENGKAYPLNTYGRNNEWILEAIMNDVNRPLEIQEKLDHYFNLIREDHFEKAQELRQELEHLIGADEPELLKADILLRRKQKSASKNETNQKTS